MEGWEAQGKFQALLPGGNFPSAISTQAKIMKQGRSKGAGEERESETETDRERHRETRDKDTETGRDGE